VLLILVKHALALPREESTMSRMLSYGPLTAVLLGIATLSTACRESEPPPPYSRNLGTDKEPLLPTGMQWSDPAVAKGQAEWYPFKEPDVGDEEGKGEARSDAGAAEAGGDENAALVKDLVTDYNDLVTEGSVDDLLAYFVESQQEVLQPWLEALVTLNEKLTTLKTALDEKLPEKGERIDAAVSALEAKVGRTLTIGTVKAENDELLTVDADGVGPSYRLVYSKDDDDWYFEMDQPGTLKPAVDAAVASCENWTQGLTSAAPADTVLSELEAAGAPAGAAADEAAAPDEKGDQPEAAGSGDGKGGD